VNRRSFLSLGIVLGQPRRAYSFIWNNPVAVMTPAMWNAKILARLREMDWSSENPYPMVESRMEGNRIVSVIRYLPPVGTLMVEAVS
jgi:branched-subunit amino acid transport protein